MSEESKYPFTNLVKQGRTAVLTLAAIYAEQIFAKREQWEPKWMMLHTAQQLAALLIWQGYMLETGNQTTVVNTELRSWLTEDTYGGLPEEPEVRDLLWQIDIDGCLENRLYCDHCGDQFGEDGDADVEALYPYRGELLCENCYVQENDDGKGCELPEPKYGKRTPGPKGVFVLPKRFFGEPTKQIDPRTGMTVVAPADFFHGVSAPVAPPDQRLPSFLTPLEQPASPFDEYYTQNIKPFERAFFSNSALPQATTEQWWYSAYWGEPFRDDTRVRTGANPIFGPYATKAEVYKVQRDVVLGMYNALVDRMRPDDAEIASDTDGNDE